MKKIITAALSLSILACNKEQPISKPIVNELFPLTVGNEWYYAKKGFTISSDTIRIVKIVTHDDFPFTISNPDLLNQYNWVKMDKFDIKLTTYNNSQIISLQTGSQNTLYSTPWLEKVATNEFFYNVIDGLKTIRYGYAKTEDINGYKAFKNHHYTLTPQNDTIFSETYYVTSGIGIVRIENKHEVLDLVGYKFN